MLTAIRWFIIFFVFWSLLLVGGNYLIDPLQFYRKSNDPVFVLNQRYQIPGLIKNYSFDTIFIGTSLSENFLTSYLDKKMGTTSLNLAISGSSAWEQSQVAQLALKNNKVKNIIWEMNYRSFSNINPNLISSGQFPVHLYITSLTTHFYYLYSIDTLWLSVKNLLKRGPKVLEGANSWYAKEAYKFDGQYVIEHYCTRIDNKNPISLSGNYKNIIQTELGSVIQSAKETQFILYIPPQSILNYMLDTQSTRFNEFRKQIYQLADKYDNVVLLDFPLNYEIISNLKNYKDIEHYNMNISETILNKISHKENLIAENGINIEIEKFNKFLNNFKQTSNFCNNKNTEEQNKGQ